ncbi:hypothetical protein M3Y94_00131300 [Aphelenchoides besseyi]|nr:hypothetical protein M3Y94_00131300 [Aphelenchoides besseyi]
MNRLLVVCVLCLLVVVQAMAMPMDKESSRVKRQWGSPFGGGFGRGPYGGWIRRSKRIRTATIFSYCDHQEDCDQSPITFWFRTLNDDLLFLSCYPKINQFLQISNSETCSENENKLFWSLGVIRI